MDRHPAGSGGGRRARPLAPPRDRARQARLAAFLGRASRQNPCGPTSHVREVYVERAARIRPRGNEPTCPVRVYIDLDLDHHYAASPSPVHARFSMPLCAGFYESAAESAAGVVYNRILQHTFKLTKCAHGRLTCTAALMQYWLPSDTPGARSSSDPCHAISTCDDIRPPPFASASPWLPLIQNTAA